LLIDLVAIPRHPLQNDQVDFVIAAEEHVTHRRPVIVSRHRVSNRGAILFVAFQTRRNRPGIDVRPLGARIARIA